jgi:hypothetical protein
MASRIEILNDGGKSIPRIQFAKNLTIQASDTTRADLTSSVPCHFSSYRTPMPMDQRPSRRASLLFRLRSLGLENRNRGRRVMPSEQSLASRLAWYLGLRVGGPRRAAEIGTFHCVHAMGQWWCEQADFVVGYKRLELVYGRHSSLSS